VKLKKEIVSKMKVKLFIIKLIAFSLSIFLCFMYNKEEIFISNKIIIFCILYFLSISFVFINSKCKFNLIIKIIASFIGSYFIVAAFYTETLELLVQIIMVIFGFLISVPLFFKSTKIFNLIIRSF